MDILSIKKEINQFFKDKKLLEFNNLCHERTLDDDYTHISSSTISKVPLYYLFDNILNSKMGGLANIRNYIINYLEINKLTNISNENLTDIGLSVHSTILYKFMVNDNRYIYYSNSGLGINTYQFFNAEKKITSCRIYHIIDEQLYNKLPNFLKNFINIVKDIEKKDKDRDKITDVIKVEQIWIDLEKIILTLPEISRITKIEYDIIVDYIIELRKTNMEDKEQILCYVLLGYICYKSRCYEHTFNKLIYGGEHEKYIKIMREYYTKLDERQQRDHGFNLKYYIDNLFDYKSHYEDEDDKKISSNEFKIYISNIYSELQKITESTIKYNLAINMMILHNYLNEKKIIE